MYAYNEIKHIHLEITSRCQASCPMCVRNIQGGIDNPWLELNEIPIENFKKWFPKEFVKNLDGLNMCGNTGDPIIARDTIEVYEYLRYENPKIFLGMNTNGSARNRDWWERLARLNVRVIFGIDGLEDTHHLYRIGTEWKKIIENAKFFIEAGGNAEWHMLIFDHNKHQVNECETLASSIGFSKFRPKNSARFKSDAFPVLTREGRTSHILYPSERSKNITKKVINLNLEEKPLINCKVKDKKDLYVNAHGEVNPCCWLDYKSSPPMGFAYVDYKDKGFIVPNLNFNTLEEIFDSGYFDQIEKTWYTDPLKTCSKECGKVDKSGEQFV
jgi:MoaA/NifB/PqqE/SkfB family radical SAM enzyme